MAALGAGEGVLTPRETEDLPEETEETEERGVDWRDILVTTQISELLVKLNLRKIGTVKVIEFLRVFSNI